MALICMQRHYNMIHNDLHTQNVMLQATDKKYLFYRVRDEYYRVPTYGYIAKVIDMGRAVFHFRNRLFMGDVFKHHNEAGEQYSYPYSHWQPKHKVKPNPAFDLARFACSMLEEVFTQPPPSISTRKIHRGQTETKSKLYNLLSEWITDQHGKPINRYEGFDLYKMIARRMCGTVPIDQLKKPCFQQYRVRWGDYKNKQSRPFVYHIY